MVDDDLVRAGLTAALAGPSGVAAAERLSAGCVELLSVDGASVSMSVGDGFYAVGSSGTGVDAVDELQFTFGEGPSLDAVHACVPVLVPDLDSPGSQRWPAFVDAATAMQVRAVFALPITVAGFPIGVLTLCRHRPGWLMGNTLTGAFLAAELAVLPLLDVLGTDTNSAVKNVGSSAWDELGSIMRSEVYQAAGFVIAQLGVQPAEAMVRLRAHAFVTGMSISDVAYQVLDHGLYLGDDKQRDQPGSEHP